MSNFQQTRPVRRAPPRASRAAFNIFSRLAKQTRYADPNLADNWPTIAGKEVAAIARPGRVLGNTRGRTLEVIVRDGAAAAEMQMRADELLEAVNRFMGPGAVGRISIRQRAGGPKPPSRPGLQRPDNDDMAGDSPLGSALSSFRAAIRARRDETKD